MIETIFHSWWFTALVALYFVSAIFSFTETIKTLRRNSQRNKRLKAIHAAKYTSRGKRGRFTDEIIERMVNNDAKL
jgi:cytochrome c biogenesis protein ResB